ncbi:hypothetical protein EJB05_27661, partial [Eragrostis curvula]
MASPPSTAEKPPVRILLRSTVHVPKQTQQGPDAEGWTKVESRSTRRSRACHVRGLRRPVPADLRGKCFNCFSPNHRAFFCRSSPRCFCCQAVGHRSYVCPARGNGKADAAGQGPQGRRISVWRRITPAPSQEETVREAPVDAAEGAVALAGAAEDAPGERRGRRRRRPRHRRRSGQGESTGPPGGPGGNGGAASPEPQVRDDGAPPAPAPPCVIDWSERIDSAEIALQGAMIVTVIGDRDNYNTEEVLDAIASQFGVNTSTLSLRRSGVAEFILLGVGDSEAARMAKNGGTPSSANPLRLHCRRWSRRAHASAATLPSLVDVELRGVPAHTWEVSTAENLLNPYGWIEKIDVATRNREDYSVFRCSAWCFQPDRIPPARDLHVVEPPSTVAELPPVKRTLVYPISFTVANKEQQGPESNDPPSPGDDSSGDGRRQRRRAHSPAPEEHHGGAQANQANSVSCNVQQQVGSTASGASHDASAVEACDTPTESRNSHSRTIDEAARHEITEFQDVRAVQKSPVGPAIPVEDAPSMVSPTLVRFEVPETPAPVAVLAAAEINSPVLQAIIEEDLREVADTLPHTQAATNELEALIREDAKIPVGPVELASPIQVEATAPAHMTASTEVQPCKEVTPCREVSPPCTPTSTTSVARALSDRPPSPLTWLPAEDVLPTEPNFEAEAQNGQNPLIVYSRRPRTPTPAATQQQQQLTPAPTFINRIAKPLQTVLPAPKARRRPARRAVTTEPPRRSRRIAKLPPEVDHKVAATVCRRLGFTDNEDRVPAATMEKYTTFFSKPLNRSHVVALAKLVGKDVPTEEQLRAAEVAALV